MKAYFAAIAAKPCAMFLREGDSLHQARIRHEFKVSHPIRVRARPDYGRAICI